MTTADMLTKIETAIRNGLTVYTRTAMRITPWTPKTYAKWLASGKAPFFVDREGHLRERSGKGSHVVMFASGTLLVGIAMQ